MRRAFIVLCLCPILSVMATFKDYAVNIHNKYRKKHHAPDLALNSDVTDYAQNWASTMASKGLFKFSGGKYGENIYTAPNLKGNVDAIKEATRLWYGDVSKYNYTEPGFSKATAQFTQVVWKNSTSMGIGIARSSKRIYVCANYDPPGNVAGQFTSNVIKP